MPNHNPVCLKGVSRRFGDQLVLQDVDFEVAQGEIFALVGHNGAGKSTIIKLISALLMPSSGLVRVFGEDTRSAGNALRAQMGVFYEPERSLYWRLSGEENLRRIATILGLDKATQIERIDHWMRFFGLEEARGRLVGQYSKGMKVKLNLIATLINEPALLILDEPLAGLDEASKNSLLALMAELARKGHTIIIGSHDIPQIQDSCSRALLLSQGRMMALDTPDRLLAAVPGDSVIEIKTKDAGSLLGQIKALCGEAIRRTRSFDEKLLLYVDEGPATLQAIKQQLSQAYYSLVLRDKLLSDVLILRETEEATCAN